MSVESALSKFTIRYGVRYGVLMERGNKKHEQKKNARNTKGEKKQWRACRGPEANMQRIFTQRTLAGYYCINSVP